MTETFGCTSALDTEMLPARQGAGEDGGFIQPLLKACMDTGSAIGRPSQGQRRTLYVIQSQP